MPEKNQEGGGGLGSTVGQLGAAFVLAHTFNSVLSALKDPVKHEIIDGVSKIGGTMQNFSLEKLACDVAQRVMEKIAIKETEKIQAALASKPTSMSRREKVMPQYAGHLEVKGPKWRDQFHFANVEAEREGNPNGWWSDTKNNIAPGVVKTHVLNQKTPPKLKLDVEPDIISEVVKPVQDIPDKSNLIATHTDTIPQRPSDANSKLEDMINDYMRKNR